MRPDKQQTIEAIVKILQEMNLSEVDYISGLIMEYKKHINFITIDINNNKL